MSSNIVPDSQQHWYTFLMKNVREKLQTLESSDKYVFHGSGYQIENFEVRQAYNYRNGEQIPDGEPAIYASHSMLYAWFMAIINDINCPHDFHSEVGSQAGALQISWVG